MYGAGSLRTVAEEVSKYKLDLVGVQEVRWDRGEKLHNEKLHNLYSSPIRMMKSRRMRWVGHVVRMGKRNAFRKLVGKPEGKRPLSGWKILK
jgi:hypothetical protein